LTAEVTMRRRAGESSLEPTDIRFAADHTVRSSRRAVHVRPKDNRRSATEAPTRRESFGQMTAGDSRGPGAR
jgi:hypothetical protein